MPSQTTNFKWSELAAGTKSYYRDRGITAASYNEWHRRPQLERTELNRIAQRHGYKDGLQFFAARSQVKSHTGKEISIVTSPKEAGRRLLAGRGRRDKGRDIVAKLF